MLGRPVSQEHGDSRQDRHRRQNKPKAARSSQAVGEALGPTGNTAGRLGQEARQPGARPGFWELEPEQTGHFPPGRLRGIENGQQGRGWRGWSAGCAAQLGGRTFKAWEDTVFTQPVQLSPG